MPRQRSQVQAVIPNAGTDAPTVTVPTNQTLLGVHIPASMTSTVLKFKVLDSASGAPKPFRKIDNTDYSITIGAAAAFYPVDPNLFEGVEFVIPSVGSAEAAARTLILVFGQTA